MDKEVKDLLERAARDLVSLEVMLFMHGHQEQASDLSDLCRRLGSEPEMVKDAVENLISAGIIECVTMGSGRYEIYSYTHDEKLRETVGRLYAYYHEDPKMRAEIIRHIISSSLEPGWRDHHTRAE